MKLDHFNLSMEKQSLPNQHPSTANIDDIEDPEIGYLHRSQAAAATAATCSSSSGPGTSYVVQIPKDQIHHVPPVVIAESRRPINNQNHRKSSSSCSNSCYCCVFLAIFIVVVAVIIYLLTYFLQPRNPIFNVGNLVFVMIKPPSSTNHTKTTKEVDNHIVEYQLRLQVRNPDWRSGISFQKGGVVSLSFRRHEIGEGMFPKLILKSNGDSSQISLLLKGRPSNQTLLLLQGRSKLDEVALVLRMNLLASMRISLLDHGDARLAVVCELVADSLGKDTRIVSQNCQVRR